MELCSSTLCIEGLAEELTAFAIHSDINPKFRHLLINQFQEYPSIFKLKNPYSSRIESLLKSTVFMNKYFVYINDYSLVTCQFAPVICKMTVKKGNFWETDKTVHGTSYICH